MKRGRAGLGNMLARVLGKAEDGILVGWEEVPLACSRPQG